MLLEVLSDLVGWRAETGWEESREGKGCCKWNPPLLRRLCCCHRLIKVVNKYTQTCRQTFLEGVLAVRSTFPAPSAACSVRAGCFLRSSPRHSCGGTEMQRLLPAALNIAARLGRPGMCTKRKGLSDRWRISQQAEPNLCSVAVEGAQNLHKPDSEMHSCSQLFEDLAKEYDYGIRCLNSRNV